MSNVADDTRIAEHALKGEAYQDNAWAITDFTESNLDTGYSFEITKKGETVYNEAAVVDLVNLTVSFDIPKGTLPAGHYDFCLLSNSHSVAKKLTIRGPLTLVDK